MYVFIKIHIYACIYVCIYSIGGHWWPLASLVPGYKGEQEAYGSVGYCMPCSHPMSLVCTTMPIVCRLLKGIKSFEESTPCPRDSSVQSMPHRNISNFK